MFNVNELFGFPDQNSMGQPQPDPYPQPGASPTLLEQLLEQQSDLLRRQIRIETRLVKLMRHLSLDADGNHL